VTKKPILQGGVQNYLGKQKEVTAPVKWKSSPNHPETELAYITKAEKDLLVKKDLHGSLKGGVNRGPSGIMSLNGYGSFDGPDPSKDTGMSGAATSDAEAGLNTANTRAEGPGSANLPPGVRDKGLDDYRNQFIAAGGGQRVNPGFFDSRNTVSPAEMARAKAFANNRDNMFARQSMRNTRGGGLMGFLTSGGLFGNLIRGLGQKFGLGKTFDQPTYDMRGITSINPTYMNDLGNEVALSTTASPNPLNDVVTSTGYPGENKNFITTTDDLISTGVQDGPYAGMYDYLEAPPIGENPLSRFISNLNFGITQTPQFDNSPYGRINDEDMVP